MALQIDIIRMLGSYKDDDVVGYIQDGVHRAMLKPYLTADTFWNHQNFEASRRSANRLAEASKLASAFYRKLPKEKRHHLLYKQLTGVAFMQLKTTTDIPAIDVALHEHVLHFNYTALPVKQLKPRSAKAFPFAIEVTKDYILIHATHLEYLEDKYGVEEVERMAAQAISSYQQTQQQPRRRKLRTRRSYLRAKEAAVLTSTAYNTIKKKQQSLLLYFHLKHLTHQQLKKNINRQRILNNLCNYTTSFMQLYHSDASNPEAHNKLLHQFATAA